MLPFGDDEAMLPAVDCLGQVVFGTWWSTGRPHPSTLAVAVLLRKPHRSAPEGHHLKPSVALMSKYDSYTIPAASHPVNNT